jgi:Tol biopolymer transport system component
MRVAFFGFPGGPDDPDILSIRPDDTADAGRRADLRSRASLRAGVLNANQNSNEEETMNSFMRLAALAVVIGGSLSCNAKDQAGSPTGPSGPIPPSTLAGLMVFVRQMGSTHLLMAMRPDGSGHLSLATTGSSPHVSPDGRKVVYSMSGGGTAVLDLGTGRSTVLTQLHSLFPRWSPDGRKLLFWSNRSGSNELWTMNADGTGAVRLSDGGGGYHEADWSPDGSRIVFRRETTDGGDIWTINADGTNAAPLYIAPRMQLHPRWAPDGQRIAFNGMVPRSGGSGVTSKLFVINADGTGLRQLTEGDLDDWGADWSPDGTRITFFRKITDPDNDLLSVRVDGIDLQVLVTGPTNDYHPTYGPAN